MVSRVIHLARVSQSAECSLSVVAIQMFGPADINPLNFSFFMQALELTKHLMGAACLVLPQMSSYLLGICSCGEGTVCNWHRCPLPWSGTIQEAYWSLRITMMLWIKLVAQMWPYHSPSTDTKKDKVEGMSAEWLVQGTHWGSCLCALVRPKWILINVKFECSYIFHILKLLLLKYFITTIWMHLYIVYVKYST